MITAIRTRAPTTFGDFTALAVAGGYEGWGPDELVGAIVPNRDDAWLRAFRAGSSVSQLGWAGSGTMLIDEVLPTFDVTRVDTVVVAAPADAVYRIAVDLDLVEVVREDPVLGALFAVRGVPDRIMRLLGRRGEPPPQESMRLGELPEEGKWIRLGEDPGREIVFGAAGRFWKGPIEWQRTTPQSFASFDAPASARIVANLAVHPYGRDRVLVTYEARTTATDDDARRGVRRYWRVLSPFIGMVLRGVLRGIKRRAEARPPGEGM
jgi:hypothetical protein